jgi:hypothetical protein
MIELTREQIRIITLTEIEYQLTTMKQYLTDEEKVSYITILQRTANLLEYQEIMKKYDEAHG